MLSVGPLECGDSSPLWLGGTKRQSSDESPHSKEAHNHRHQLNQRNEVRQAGARETLISSRTVPPTPPTPGPFLPRADRP